MGADDCWVTYLAKNDGKNFWQKGRKKEKEKAHELNRCWKLQ
jgi:hypothetical protein